MALDVPDALAGTATEMVLAQYPDVNIERSTLDQIPEDHASVHRHLRLVPDVQSLVTLDGFEDRLTRTMIDPVTSILQAVAPQNSSQQTEIRLRFIPVSKRRRLRARRIAGQYFHSALQLWPMLADRYAKLANGSTWERVVSRPLRMVLPSSTGDIPVDVTRKLDDHLFAVSISMTVTAPVGQEVLSAKKLRQLVAALAPLSQPGRAALVPCRRPVASLLCCSELASMWHVPTALVETPQTARTAYRQLPPPVNLPEASLENASERGMVLGRVAYGRDRRLCRVLPADRLHTLLVGKSGTGKSTLLHNMVAVDAVADGLAVVDPHGDLISDVLTQGIPRRRTNDVILFDPSANNPIKYNPLACDDPARRSLVAESLLAALRKVFGFDEASAPRLINTLRYTLLALLETDSATLLSIRPMLTDKTFRKTVVGRLQDEEVRGFWQQEVANWTDRYEKEAMPAILNKLGQFTANPYIRRVLDAPKGSINLRQVMDRRQILLANLSQGKLGEDAARMLGSLLMAGIQQAAMSRADLPKDERSPFYVYADEYATYVNESFADTLAQARKYGLYLTAAQQIIDQVDESIMAAMFGNCSTIVCFQVARDDAERMAEQLTGNVTPEDLQQLPKYTAVVRMAIDGVPARPFTIKTLPPPQRRKSHASPDRLTASSHRRFVRAA